MGGELSEDHLSGGEPREEQKAECPFSLFATNWVGGSHRREDEQHGKQAEMNSWKKVSAVRGLAGKIEREEKQDSDGGETPSHTRGVGGAFARLNTQLACDEWKRKHRHLDHRIS